MNNMVLKEAKELFDAADLTNWETTFELLKIQLNPKIRLLSCDLLVKQKCYKKLELFLNDQDGHVRKYSNLYYYKRACISSIGEKITYNFLPYLNNVESSKLFGEYPHTITIGHSDFRYFFAQYIENCLPIFDHTSNNYIPKQVWITILSLLYKSTENYNCDYRDFVMEMLQWIELKLDLSDGISIWGNL